jgi:hypothetical protein
MNFARLQGHGGKWLNPFTEGLGCVFIHLQRNQPLFIGWLELVVERWKSRVYSLAPEGQSGKSARRNHL